MTGITTSLTSESTILPNAAPMMMPTARSITLPLTANSRNSFNMPIVIFAALVGWGRRSLQADSARPVQTARIQVANRRAGRRLATASRVRRSLPSIAAPRSGSMTDVPRCIRRCVMTINHSTSRTFDVDDFTLTGVSMSTPTSVSAGDPPGHRQGASQHDCGGCRRRRCWCHCRSQFHSWRRSSLRARQGGRRSGRGRRLAASRPAK